MSDSLALGGRDARASPTRLTDDYSLFALFLLVFYAGTIPELLLCDTVSEPWIYHNNGWHECPEIYLNLNELSHNLFMRCRIQLRKDVVD